MRKIFLIICLLTFFSGFLFSQKGYRCRWRDNSSEDNKLPDSYYISAKKGALLYCFTNDDANIYLDMIIKETAEQNRILKAGLTLWIDVEGKSKKKTGIRYPIGSDYSGFRRRQGEGQTNTPLSMANTIQLIGIKKEGSTRIPSDNPEGIRGAVRYDNEGNLIYRLVVPISEIEGLSERAGKPLTFCIEYGSPPPDMGLPFPGMPSGGTGGGMPRPPAGGRGGMPAGGGMPSGGFSGTVPGQQDQTPVKIWVKNVYLATKS